MKIGILTFPINTSSGLGRYIHDFSSALEKQGNQVEILELGGSWLGYIVQVRRFAKKADVIYALDINPFGFLGFFATRITGAKFILLALATYSVAPLYNWKQSFFARMIVRRSDAVIAVSKFTRDEMLKKVPGAKIHVINLGVDPTRFATVNSVQSERPYLIGVGALKTRKGYDTSIRAFAQVAKNYPTLRYIIVGSHTQDPAYFKSLQTLTQELGVEGRVEFPERVSDEELLRLYAGASVFIITSVNEDEAHHFEGFGLVFLEAAARGLPAIGTLGNGIEDAIVEGQTGFLVPQRDVAATADAIEKLINDPELRARMSAAARASVQTRTWGDVARQYEEVCRSILKK